MCLVEGLIKITTQPRSLAASGRSGKDDSKDGWNDGVMEEKMIADRYFIVFQPLRLDV